MEICLMQKNVVQFLLYLQIENFSIKFFSTTSLSISKILISLIVDKYLDFESIEMHFTQSLR